MDSYIFTIASFIGTAAFACSGLMIGVRKEMDIMGLFIMAMLTANGGGALRDILVGRPPVVLTDLASFYIVCGVIVVSLLFRLHKYSGMERRVFFVLGDSIGLVAFSITGAIVGLNAGFNFFGVIVLAFLTATGGGMLRDIITNEVPVLLSSGFYGSVAVLIACALCTLHSLAYLNDTTTAIVALIGICIRLLAYFQNWHLPSIKKGFPYLNP